MLLLLQQLLQQLLHVEVETSRDCHETAVVTAELATWDYSF